MSEVCPDESDFLCLSDGYSSCFPNSWKCDGEPDCDGNVDEQGCRKYFRTRSMTRLTLTAHA